MEWKKPWYPIDPDETLVNEAEKEISKGHMLYGKKLRAIGRNQSQDEVLYELVDEPPKVALVHLVWSGKKDTPPWPTSQIFESLEEFANGRMQDDALAW